MSMWDKIESDWQPDNIKWGVPIEVNGVRPGWLKGGDEWEWRKESGNFVRATSFPDAYTLDEWATFASIRLPASHPYYLATSKGFTYWPGRDDKPEDFNDIDKVMFRSGEVCSVVYGFTWRHHNQHYDIIGYNKKQPATEKQVYGDHYTKMVIQPFEYSMANNLDPLQHTIIKYVSRFRDKNGVTDLKKAIHCLEMLIEFEESK